MKADITKIFNLLNGDKHYVIPMYQRLYSWNLENCKKLFLDVVDLVDTNKTHFVGSIVEIIHPETNSGTLSSNVLIDGQQRFTTFTLFILALMHHFEIENWEEIENTYLVNQYKSNDEHYKLLLIEKDMEILKKIINKTKMSQDDEQSQLYINFVFFKQEIVKNEFTFNQLLKALKNLTVVIIDLDIDDKPQLIFESINSTGLDLSEGDLIKNYILMGLNPEEQKNIYDKFWKEIEDELIRFKQLDSFFKHFLTIKTGKIPNIKKIYEEFKKYHRSFSNINIFDFVKEIYDYFEIFHKILTNQFEEKKLAKSMKSLSLLKIEVINPLLIELFKHNKNDLINSEDLNYLIDIFTSYIVRRQFCSLPSAALNKAFVSLINKSENTNNIKESILASLLTFENTQKFPTDTEFKESFITRNFYDMKSKNAILEIIENHANKTQIEFSNYTVEHILPQGDNLPTPWKEALGDDWKNKFETWVQTIGNITLTLYNSELSNHTFTKKKSMDGGFIESQLKLNKFVVNCEEWNDLKIKARAQDLFKYCLSVWERPIIEQSILEKYHKHLKNRNVEYTLSDYKYYNDSNMNKLYDKLINFSKNINPDISIKAKKLYINILEDEDILASFSINKTNIKMYFYITKDLVDDQKICKNVENIGHWGNGNTEIIIDENNFDKCSKIIEQILDTDN